MTNELSFLRFFLFFIFIFLNLVFGRGEILAQCNKTTLSGNGSGISCIYNGVRCDAGCASGWSTSCSNGYSDSGSARCYISDENCNNTATCYKCNTGQRYYYCNKSSHTCSQTNSTYTDYSSCQSNLATYMPGQTDGYCYSTGSACSMNCTAATPTKGPTPTPFRCTSNSQCNDNDSCTTDTCSNGSCSHRDNGSCNVTPDPECITPYCLDSGYSWALNCGVGDCWMMNFWLSNQYYVCCKPAFPYICKSSGWWNGTGCYSEPMCNYCGGACIDEECPDTCHTNILSVKGGEIGGWCSYKSCLPNQVDGRCGIAQGLTYGNSKPISGLCYAGIPSEVTNDGTHWNWTCDGAYLEGCITPGTTASCWAISNRTPVFNGLIIRNNVGVTVPPESGNRNQICQTIFNNTREVYFVVYASDPDGILDITNVTLSWNGQVIPRVSSIGASTVFGGYFPPSWGSSLSDIALNVTITDTGGSVVTSSPRNFKFWDCGVGVSGVIYDSTDDGGPSCPTTGFTKLATKDALNFKSLTFNGGGTGVNMTVNADGISYNNGSNYLTWGINGYVPSFNTDISLSDRSMKSKPTTAATWDCNWYLDTTKTDAYSSNPTILADFSGVIIQAPWWQTNNGGAISNTEAIGRVPVTCPDDTCKICRNALLSAPLVSNGGSKSLTDAQVWYYNGSGAKLVDVNSNYGYFYDKYLVKKGQGTTLASGDRKMSEITNTSGIYFVDGNFNIDTNKVTNDAFFMVVVKGNMTVDPTVTQVDGIYVANNITATGVGDNQLVFNGSLYASNTVNFSRDYTDKLSNNTNPSVLVNYNPKLIFELPGDLAKILVNWQWGN